MGLDALSHGGDALPLPLTRSPFPRTLSQKVISSTRSLVWSVMTLWPLGVSAAEERGRCEWNSEKPGRMCALIHSWAPTLLPSHHGNGSRCPLWLCSAAIGIYYGAQRFSASVIKEISCDFEDQIVVDIHRSLLMFLSFESPQIIVFS